MERAFGKPEPKSALVPLKGAAGVDTKPGIVMVVGATGGVGKRVVERLLKRGYAPGVRLTSRERRSPTAPTVASHMMSGV